MPGRINSIPCYKSCNAMPANATKWAQFCVPKKGEFFLPGYFCCRCVSRLRHFFHSGGPGTGPLYSLTENPCRTLIFVYICSPQALVAELVDAHDSKSCAFGRGGSIPSWGTRKSNPKGLLFCFILLLSHPQIASFYCLWHSAIQVTNPGCAPPL